MDIRFNSDDFKTSDFDVNHWISNVLSNVAQSSQLEMAIDRISCQIQDEIQKTTENLDMLTQQMVVQVPKVARDFESTHKEVNQLQHEIVEGFNEAEIVQRKTTSSMNTLERLDNIKTNLVATSSALQEADKWTSLAKQIEQLLDSGDVHNSYECILGMEKSLSVLDQSPAEDRRLILEEMKNRLEALATKHLIHAFDTNDEDNARKFYTMFANLERPSQYIKYFENCEKIKLSQEWRNHVELLTFKEATIKFYDELMDHFRAKVIWCKNVFSQKDDNRSLDVLVGLYAETIRSLEPSLEFCFESETKKLPFLDVLIHFNQTTHRFIENFRQFITGCDAEPDSEKISHLLQVTFSPFIPQYSKYSKHYESQIVSKIQSAIAAIASGASIGEIPGVLQERIDCMKRLLPEICLVVKECEEKILNFNNGYGYYHFGKGINRGMERLVEWYQEVFRTLDKSLNQSDRQRNLLENSLAFAEVCGEVFLQIGKLDESITTNCQRMITKLNAPKIPVWEKYSEFYVDNQIRSEIVQFLAKNETLLKQSITLMQQLCKDATKLVLKVTAEPAQLQLKSNFMLVDSNLKEAIPSEYVTQIGEYLMLLPQNLDPFISSDSLALSSAFDQTVDENDSRSPVDYILSSLSTGVCESYAERILKIHYLSDGQAKQLAQDIDYLASVLEDLGVGLNADLSDICKLMKMFPTINESTAIDKASSRILNAVKKMKVKPA